MRVIFKAKDGGKCSILISNRNLNKLRSKYSDLIILDQDLIPYHYHDSKGH